MPSSVWRRKSKAWSSPESGWNQTGCPCPSRISGPCALAPRLGAAKTGSVAASGVAVTTSTAGGRRSGRDTKLWIPLSPGTGASSNGGGGAFEAGAITKEVSSPSAPAIGRPASTLTRSSGANGSSGTNAAPSPSGCGRQRPLCGPLTEPVTVRSPRSSAAAPRTTIVVPGRAATTRLPG